MYDPITRPSPQAVAERRHQRLEFDAAYNALRVQFQRAAAAAARGSSAGSATDRTIANTCSAAATNPNFLSHRRRQLLRPDQERHSVAHAVQARRDVPAAVVGRHRERVLSRRCRATCSGLRADRRRRRGTELHADVRGRFGLDGERRDALCGLPRQLRLTGLCRRRAGGAGPPSPPCRCPSCRRSPSRRRA